jgi:DNA-binding GntR family transcriptional regulator
MRKATVKMPLGDMGQTLTTERLSEQIYQQLRKAIIEGTLAPGDRLSIKDLAERFRVSTTPVRDALKLLEADFLVESIPRRGTLVTRLSRSRIQDIFQIRRILESAAAERVAEVSDDTVQRLRQIAQQMKGISGRSAYGDRYRQLHEEFHQLIISILGNRMASEFYETLRWAARWSAQAARVHAGPEIRLAHEEEHLAIAEAIAQRDQARAKELVCSHLRGAEEDLLRYMPPEPS